jgi:hypothetical protein
VHHGRRHALVQRGEVHVGGGERAVDAVHELAHAGADAPVGVEEDGVGLDDVVAAVGWGLVRGYEFKVLG